MKKYIEKLCVASILGLIIVIFTREFVDRELLKFIETGFLILVIITGLSLAKGIPFYFSLLGLILGHIFFFKYNMSYDLWMEGITKNLPLAILFVMVPVITIPLRQGGYLSAINHYVNKYLEKTCSLFLVLSSFVFALGSITNLGSIRISHALLEDINFPKKFLGQVYSIGFVGCITWSPYFASVNLILYYTQVPFGSYVFWGFLLGLSFLIIGNLLFYKHITCQTEVRKAVKVIEDVIDNDESNRKIKQLLLNISGLFITVIIGERLFKFSSMMFLISLIAVAYAIFWSASIRQLKDFFQQLKSYDQNILQVKNEVVFFLSIGFFGVVLANTPVRNIIESFFVSVSGFSTFFVIELVIVITAMLSSLGIHHIITITTLGLSLQPGVLGLTDLTYALTLSAAYSISMLLSPFVPFNVLAGGLLKEKSYVIGLKWNRTFGLVAILFSGIYVTLVNMLLN